MTASPRFGCPIRPLADLRALVTHRMRLVRMRTMVKNGLHAIAMNRRLTLGPSLCPSAGSRSCRASPSAPHTASRRDEKLKLLTWLTARIEAPRRAASPTRPRPIRGPAPAHPSWRRPADGLDDGPGTRPGRPLPAEQARRQLHRPGPGRPRLRRHVPPRQDHQTGQRACSGWILGQAGLRSPRQLGCRASNVATSDPAPAPRPPQSQRRHCPETARAALHHAPGSD